MANAILMRWYYEKNYFLEMSTVELSLLNDNSKYTYSGRDLAQRQNPADVCAR